MERNVKWLVFEDMCQFWFSLSVSVSFDLIVLVWFCSCFFFFCFFVFWRLSFIQILALVVLSFYHFEGSFHFWALLWGLVLRPFSTCASLMSFSPFCMFIVASFSSGCFFFSFLFYLLSRVRRRDPFLCVCDLFGVFWFGLKKKKKSWAVFNPSLSFTGSVLSSLQSLDPFIF